jgi:hypothetical protein
MRPGYYDRLHSAGSVTQSSIANWKWINLSFPFRPHHCSQNSPMCRRAWSTSFNTAYLEWVQGEWAESADTVEGRGVHRRVDASSGKLPEAEAIGDDERIHVRSVTLASDRLGLIAKLDLVEVEDGSVVPVDCKRGKRPHVAAGAYEPELVQLCVQGLIIEDNGYRCTEGALYFRGSRERGRCRIALEGARCCQRPAPGRCGGTDPATPRR